MLRSIISSWLFGLLLIVDLIFVVLHCFHYYGILPSPMFSIEMDGSLAEWYQYGKELTIVILLLWMYKKYPWYIFLSWALLFAYFLLDDAMQIHENLGVELVTSYGLKPWNGLRAEDLGELMISCVFGLFFLLFLVISYVYANKQAKEIAKQLFILVIVLVFFGVFLDMAHIVIPYWKGKIGVLEDGGEMIAMSAICAYVMVLNGQDLNYLDAEL